MVMTLRSARAARTTLTLQLVNNSNIEIPFPIYILHELAKSLSYSDIRALHYVSKAYFVWVYKSIPQMLELNAENCLIGERFLSTYPLAKFTNLKKLILSHNFINSLKVVSKLRFLQELDLSYNVGRILIDGSLTELQQLRTLKISGNYLRSHHLEQILTLTRLDHLEMAEFRTLTAFPIETLSALTSLTTLNLARNYISSKVMRSLATLTRLADLDLSCCTTGPKRYLENLSQLTRLNLTSTALGIDRMSFASLTQLQWLDISNNLLDDTCLKTLAIPTCILELNIATAGVTDASFEELRRLTCLKSVFLHGNAMTEKGKEDYSRLTGVLIKQLPLFTRI